MFYVCCLLAMGSLMTGCDTSLGPLLPSQTWQGKVINVETRPAPMRPGMNEFLVLVNEKHKGFLSSIVLDVRTSDSGWQQAIPDGALGVYRRALMVKDPKTVKLYIRIRDDKGKATLIFDFAHAHTQP